MLILPIENKPDWSRPPLITIGLILINVLVFVFYQGNDPGIMQRASAIYAGHNLLELERTHYLDYLKAKRVEDHARLTRLPRELQDQSLFWSIFYDREFDQYLAERWQKSDMSTNESTTAWRDARKEFQQERNRLSSFAAGLTPAQSKLWTFFTSMFLHGGMQHLLGNMVFLFLFGFALEAALKYHIYLGMYLASGLVANLLFVALNLGSYTPLVGASGAISGLMGMYLALYRLRRIRFFYTLFFYFGELRAPAILVLPLWLAKELYGYFFTDSNTAYWAHIGGLLAGAGLMQLTPKSHQEFNQAQEVREQESELARGLRDVQLALSQLNYNRARSLARMLCEQYPLDPRPWRTLFDLHKLQPNQKAFHETVFNLLKQFSSRQSPYAEWKLQVDDVLEEYRQAAPKTPAFTGNLCLAMANKHWRNGARHEAENFIKRAQEKGANPQACIRLLTEMRDYYQQRRQLGKAEKSAESIRLLQQFNPPAAE